MSQRTAQVRRVGVWLAVIAGAAAAGYVATCAIFPAPIVAKKIVVPSLRGAAADVAITRLTGLQLRGRLTDTVPDPLTPAGTIAWQSPAPETALPQGAVVKLGVSSGAPLVSMPDVTNLDQALAMQVVEAAGLLVGRVDTVPGNDEFGTVISTMPGAGTPVNGRDSVRLAVSSGPASVAVPDLVGLTVAAARDRLAAAGLRVGVLDQRFEGNAGTILAQYPGVGELVTRESGVALTVSGTIP